MSLSRMSNCFSYSSFLCPSVGYNDKLSSIPLRIRKEDLPLFVCQSVERHGHLPIHALYTFVIGSQTVEHLFSLLRR